MPKTFLQAFNSGGTPSGSPLTTVLGFPGAFTPGSAVFVGIHQLTTSSRTYTITGSVTGTTGWVRHLRHSAGAGGPEIWCHPNHPGGVETISVSHGSGTADFRAMAAEFSGMGGTVTLDTSAVYTDGAVTATHYCADSPGVTTAADVVGFLCAGTATASTWTSDAATGIWTQFSGGAVSIAAYTIRPTGVTNERGEYTSSGTQRQGKGMIAFFTGAAAAAPTVTDVTPDTDEPAGGATVTITGTGFVATPAVTFGGVPATGEAWISATSMTAVVPAHAEGLVAVRVTNPDTQYGELASAFLYDSADLPVVLQGPIGVVMVSGVGEIELTGTTAGSRIIGVVLETDAAIRSYGASDDVNGAYDSLLTYNPARGVYVFEIRNNIGGDLTVTFQKTAGGYSVPVAYVMEVSNLRTDISPITSTRVDSASTTSHPGSAAPGMNTESYPVFALSVAALNGTTGVVTPATGYTAVGTPVGNSFLQYKIAASGLLDDQAAWISANSRIATSAQLAFYATAGEAPAASTDGVHVTMFW